MATSASTSFPPSSLGLDAVNVSKFSSDTATSSSTADLPLVITPRWENSLDFFAAWCRANHAWLDAMMLKYGALLIRGFQIETARDMELALAGYQPCLNDTYRGTSPRKLIEGAQKVFSAAEVPSNYPIAQHLEMSFLDAPPAQLYFGCLKPSASAGGETALCDFAQVARDLSPHLKQKFLDKGIRYTRTHRKVGTHFTYDVSDMLGWPAMFGTDSKKKVEEMCTQEGIPVDWVGANQDTFVSVTQQDAFQLHPVTGELVWFNHTQVFHWTTFPEELWFAFTRCRDWRLLLHCIFVTVFCLIQYGLLGRKMGLDATFGDGTPISAREMKEIRDCIHKNMIYSRWQKGDMIWIDNFRVSHGRQPTYDKSRKVVVAWADPLRKANAVMSLDETKTKVHVTANTTEAEAAVVDEKAIVEPPLVVCMENPQERTPESTLTRETSSDLLFGVQDKIALKEAARKLAVLNNEKDKESSNKNISDNPQDLLDDIVSDQTLGVLKNLVARAEARKTSCATKHHEKRLSATATDFWQPED